MQNLLFTDALKLKRLTAFNVMSKPAGASCNLNCTYCYYLEKRKLFPGRNELRMSEKLLEDFTKQFIESQQAPAVTFTWQGGEPTLMGLDFFRKAIEYQKKYASGKKIENAFQTNGTRLDDEWCKFFADNKILVGISIDGEEHNHDHYRRTFSGGPTFRKVIKGIELLHKNKVEFNTLSTVNDYNVHYAAETYRFLKRTGSGFIQFLPVVERIRMMHEENSLKLIAPVHGDAPVSRWSVGAKEYGDFLITIFDEWVRTDVARHYVQIFDATLANYVGENPGICVFAETCGDALVMEHNGDLYSCDHFVYPEYLLGNIAEKPLAELATSQSQFDFGIAKRNSLPRYCINCEVLYACHGECPKHRFSKTPDGRPGLNYLCEGYKMFFKHVEPYMEYMAREFRNKRPPANVMSWIRNKENQSAKPLRPKRNDPCPCGSGKKFKNCCMNKWCNGTTV
jgi:serine-type anaerobic sulfatase-maturating enzyme